MGIICSTNYCYSNRWLIIRTLIPSEKTFTCKYLLISLWFSLHSPDPVLDASLDLEIITFPPSQPVTFLTGKMCYIVIETVAFPKINYYRYRRMNSNLDDPSECFSNVLLGQS